MSNLVDFSTIIGKKVICANGYILGEVKGANIDTKTWQITQVYLKLTDTAAEELGYKKRFRSSNVAMPVKFIKAVADVVTVYPSLKELTESNEINPY